MARQALNFGTGAADDGEFLSTAMPKVEANFVELYGRKGPLSQPYRETASYIGAAVCSNATSLALTANRLYKTPVIFAEATTILQADIYIFAAVAGNVRIGLRKWEAGKATTLVADFGSVSSASTGIKSITGLSVAVEPGLYMMEIVSDVACTVGAGVSAGVLPVLGYYLSGSSVTHVYRAFTYGALPADETAQTQTSAISNPPLFGMKDW